MTDKIDGISDGDSWLRVEEEKSQDSTEQVDAGSLSFQLEMRAAIDSITQDSAREKQQADQNAKDEGFQSPPVPTF